MFSTRIRWALIAIDLLLAVYFARRGPVVSVLGLVSAALLIYGYFRSGTVWIAFQRLRRGDEAAAVRLLDQVKRPERLAPGQRAYFELMRGSIALDQERALDAVAHLSAVRDLPVRTRNDRALAELLLARALHASSAGADAVANALDRARDAADRHERRVAIESFEVVRALDALAASEGVRVAAAVGLNGAIASARGIDVESFPATLKEALAAASLPEDAAGRLAAGDSLRVPLDAAADRFAFLRLLESRRGLLLIVSTSASSPDPAADIDRLIVALEALEPPHPPLGEPAIAALLRG